MNVENGGMYPTMELIRAACALKKVSAIPGTSEWRFCVDRKIIIKIGGRLIENE
jgi:hypothetical protein